MSLIERLGGNDDNPMGDKPKKVKSIDQDASDHASKSSIERAGEQPGHSAFQAIGKPKSNKTHIQDKKERKADPTSMGRRLFDDEKVSEQAASTFSSAQTAGGLGEAVNVAQQQTTALKLDTENEQASSSNVDSSVTVVKEITAQSPEEADALNVSGSARVSDVAENNQNADSAPKPAARSRSKYQEVDLARLRDAGYLTPDMPASLMSEEIRLIKRTLLLRAFAKNRNIEDRNNLVLVTSSQPNEGKTFFSMNLALSIATEQDVTVLLVDGDFSKPEILNRFGVSGGKGLMDVVAEDDLDIGDCLVRTNIPNLVLLPAGRQHNLTNELLASDRMAKIMEEIATRYPDRIVIFDSPPALANSAASVLALYMGQAVFVIEAEKTAEYQIKESLNMIGACPNIGLVLNKTRFDIGNQKFASYYGYGG